MTIEEIAAEQRALLVAQIVRKLSGKTITIRPGPPPESYSVRVIGYTYSPSKRMPYVLAEIAEKVTSTPVNLDDPTVEITASRTGTPAYYVHPRWFEEAMKGEETVDTSRFPHVCPRCTAPAYVGLAQVDCSKACAS